ncbi:MAG TPA: DUF2336 domain-containing protein [Bradyrhizobium sp.]|nr:DUF2336 domain-containing protein [Bradyrhizobium sp.]
MTTSPLFPGFDGLMSLSRREGVDIRPTLLRVLTDLYVQTKTHSEEEARQFVELTSRLIDQVDDATRAAVRARLAVYPGTPAAVLRQLGLKPNHPDRRVPLAREIPANLIPSSSIPANPSAAPGAKAPSEAQLRLASNLSMQPTDAAEIVGMFFGASSSERALILHNLSETPLKASPRVPAARAARAIEALEMAAFVADVENFTLEIGETLILPWKTSTQVVNDPGGEPLACAAKALGMPSPVFQRVLLFLKPEIGTSVHTVYRLSRLYDILGERSALIMLAAWRGSTMAATRAKYRPALYDDERNRARPAAAQTRTVTQPPGTGAVARTGTQGSGR